MVARKAATALRLMLPPIPPTQRSREAQQRWAGGRNRFAVAATKPSRNDTNAQQTRVVSCKGRLTDFDTLWKLRLRFKVHISASLSAVAQASGFRAVSRGKQFVPFLNSFIPFSRLLPSVLTASDLMIFLKLHHLEPRSTNLIPWTVVCHYLSA